MLQFFHQREAKNKEKMVFDPMVFPSMLPPITAIAIQLLGTASNILWHCMKYKLFWWYIHLWFVCVAFYHKYWVWWSFLNASCYYLCFTFFVVGWAHLICIHICMFVLNSCSLTDNNTALQNYSMKYYSSVITYELCFVTTLIPVLIEIFTQALNSKFNNKREWGSNMSAFSLPLCMSVVKSLLPFKHLLK